jgi:hypothetical protein
LNGAPRGGAPSAFLHRAKLVGIAAMRSSNNIDMGVMVEEKDNYNLPGPIYFPYSKL